jgi:preprotein translocase subunit SecY
VNSVVLQLFRVPEIRRRIVTTLGLLLVFRIGHQIPIPGMSPEFVRRLGQDAGSTVFGLLSAFSGGMLGQTVMFSLGIMPYISASIIFSILAKVSPSIEALQKEGATGQKKINQYTRLATVPIAFLQALFIWFGIFAKDPEMIARNQEPGLMLMTVVVLALVASSVFCMWLGEMITEYGVGNGASLIIMAGIIAEMPGALAAMYAQQPDSAYNTMMMLLGIWIAIVLVIVFIQKGERRIPIQYARLTRGRKMALGPRHFLPLKINMAGVMPIIFASALFILPSLLFGALGWDTLNGIIQDQDGFVHILISMLLVFGFCFFWNSLMFRPEEIADNLREHGSFVPGLRPGAKTAEFLKGVLNRITLAGAAFLALITVLPNFITGGIPGLQGQLAYFLGGTSVLIVVGVAQDLVDKLNAQLVMRNYEGFMKGGGASKGGAGAWARRSEG